MILLVILSALFYLYCEYRAGYASSRMAMWSLFTFATTAFIFAVSHVLGR